MGEAKATATTAPRTPGDLERLGQIRRLLVEQGWDAGEARLLLTSRTGLAPELSEPSATAAAGAVSLIDLPTMYTGPRPLCGR